MRVPLTCSLFNIIAVIKNIHIFVNNAGLTKTPDRFDIPTEPVHIFII